MLHVNVDHYHTTNRTATTNGLISLACAAGLGKYGYGNGFTVMERISGTVLTSLIFLKWWTGFREFLAMFPIFGPFYKIRLKDGSISTMYSAQLVKSIHTFKHIF